MHFIGDVTGDVIVNTQAGIPYTGNWAWDQYDVPCWNSRNNTKVTVRIVNLETDPGGVDFGLDDFSFRQCCNPDACCRYIPPTDRQGQFENTITENAFTVFSNPGNGTFEINLDHAVVNANAELINVLGERVATFTFSGNTYKFTPQTSLSKGVYMLRITADGEQLNKQVIIE